MTNQFYKVAFDARIIYKLFVQLLGHERKESYVENRILIRAGMKRHKGSLSGIFLLIFLVSLILATVLAIWSNAGSYIQAEIDRAGFGNVTAWVSKVPKLETLQEQIASQEEIQKVEVQNLIFAEYEINEQESDSEGQLIVYQPEEERYRFFDEKLGGYENAPAEIEPGQVYVSPSLVSMMNVTIGEKIEFPIARNGVNLSLTVAGFYEDPFMGSSMIGMKGFLISEADQNQIIQTIEEAKMDALARAGTMLHIFVKEESDVTAIELSTMLNENTELPMYTEFIHSNNAISGFMLILQNAFGGLFLAFALVLLCITMVVLGHSISAVMEQEYRNMGILKTVGMTAEKLAGIQLVQYLAAIFSGMIFGILLSVLLGNRVSLATVTTTGILIPSRLPVLKCILCFAGIAVLLLGFILIKLRKISFITPMKAIRGETDGDALKIAVRNPIHGRYLKISLALRQLIAGRRKYVSAGLVAILLVFFASLVGRMDSWLGSDGKGMMDAFHPADHDIGVQTLGNLTPQEAENQILFYTDITDRYLLAMPDVSVNGVNFTANVITEPERFHITEGDTSADDDEIVLTESAALDLGVSIGDTVSLRGDKGVSEFTISGIYQCANDMGNNIGMNREGYLKIGQDDTHLWCYHYFLADPSVKQEITESLEKTYGGDVHIHENSWPGLFGIISAMQILVFFMYGIVAFFVLIVTIMTAGKLLAGEQKDMGIFKALGFKTVHLRITFALRFTMTAMIGAVIGTVLASIFTDPFVSKVMKLAGISNFVSAPNLGRLLLPGVIVVVLFGSFAYFASGKIKKVDMAVLAAE